MYCIPSRLAAWPGRLLPNAQNHQVQRLGQLQHSCHYHHEHAPFFKVGTLLGWQLEPRGQILQRVQLLPGSPSSHLGCSQTADGPWAGCEGPLGLIIPRPYCVARRYDHLSLQIFLFAFRPGGPGTSSTTLSLRPDLGTVPPNQCLSANPRTMARSKMLPLLVDTAAAFSS
jgi:hypothetical protein